MSASTSGTKTVTRDVSPYLTASTLTALLATPIESLTVAQFNQLKDALTRISGGGNPAAVIGQLLI